MHVLTTLLLREVAMLAVLVALGSGAAAFLDRRIDALSRWALAPVFGLAIGSCAATTLLWQAPMDTGAWLLLPPLVVASVAVAVWRTRRQGLSWAVGGAGAAQALLVVIVTSAAVLVPLVDADTFGPVSYQVGDAPGYLAETIGLEQQSIDAADDQREPFVDLTLRYWWFMASGVQQMGFNALSGATNVVFGFDAATTQSVFLVALLAVMGLGLLATVRLLTRGGPGVGWVAALAGCLCGGPFFLQLFMDGSQAAIAGLTLLAPLIALAALVIDEPRLPMVGAFALLAAGLHTLYPLFVPAVAVAGALVLLVLFARTVARRAALPTTLARNAVLVGTVLALAIAFSPVAFARNAEYWIEVARGAFFGGVAGALPKFDLPLQVLPGWLLQTRSFYELSRPVTTKEWALADVIPFLLLVVVAVGLLRHRAGWLFVAVGAVAGVLAWRVATAEDCSYCEQRNLLVVAPLLIVLLALGLTALVRDRGRWGMLIVASTAGTLVLVVGDRSRDEQRRIVGGAYVLPRETRELFGVAGRVGGGVFVENFDQTPKAPYELPSVYHALNEEVNGRLSLNTTDDDRLALAYLGGPREVGVEYDPGYGLVLTRTAAVATNRRTLARRGPVALQERARPLDVTFAGGISVEDARFDPDGRAWVVGPELAFFVTGQPEGALLVELRHSGPLRVGAPARVVRRARGEVLACVPFSGPPPLRRVAFPVSASLPPAPAADEYGLPRVSRGVEVISVRARAGPCPATGAAGEG